MNEGPTRDPKFHEAGQELHDALADGKEHPFDPTSVSEWTLKVLAVLVAKHEVLVTERIIVSSPPIAGEIVLEIAYTGALQSHYPALDKIIVEQAEFVGWATDGKTTRKLNRQCMGGHALKINLGGPAFSFRDCTFEGFEDSGAAGCEESKPPRKPPSNAAPKHMRERAAKLLEKGEEKAEIRKIIRRENPAWIAKHHADDDFPSNQWIQKCLRDSRGTSSAD